MKFNTDVRYGSVTRLIHWFLAIVIISMLLGVFYIGLIPQNMKGTFFLFHKSFGVTVLVLMLCRLAWAIENVKPKLPQNMPIMEKILARGAQHLLMFFAILMPLSGWIMATAAGRAPNFFGLVSLPLPFIPLSKPLAENMESLHFYCAWTLITLICLHVLGALKHHFINKDDVLRHML